MPPQELRKVRLLLGRRHVERVTEAMAAAAAAAAADAVTAAAAEALTSETEPPAGAAGTDLTPAGGEAASSGTEQQLQHNSAPAALEDQAADSAQMADAIPGGGWL